MIKNRFLQAGVLILFATILMFFKFDQIPKGLAHDENELARVAFSLENKPYTAFTPVADGHGTPYFYTLLGSFKIFGINQFALRLPSKIFGIISILLLYFILREVFKKDILAFAFSLLLLTSRWYLHFSRVSFEMPFLLFLELVSAYSAVLFLKTRRYVYLILSGVAAGIAYNSYQPGRIFFLVPLAIFFLTKIPLKRIVLYFLVPFLLCILPMSFYLVQHPANDIRINEQFFLKNTSLSLQEKVQFLGSNIAQTALMFVSVGDMNGQHNYPGKPALNPIFFVFFIIGFIKVCLDFREPFNSFFLLYFFIALLPTILTYPWENPNMLRTYTALPSIIYFTGQGILLAYNVLRAKIKSERLIIIILAFLVGCSLFYELRTYFLFHSLVFKQAFDIPDYLSIIRQNALNGR